MIEVSNKDLDRAKSLYQKTDKQIEACLDRILDPRKLLARGIAFGVYDEFSGNGNFDHMVRHDRFAYRAKDLGATEDDLREYVARRNECYAAHARVRQDRDQKKIAAIRESIPEGLAKFIGSNKYFSLQLNGRGQRYRRVYIYQDHSSGEFIADIYKTARSKNSTRVFLGRAGTAYTTFPERARLEAEMIVKHQIKVEA